ncbi:MAG TPA: lactonase family protein [Phycisphaerae bacterium]|nr:lactonase family protein [Phycisphaerae bacterium]
MRISRFCTLIIVAQVFLPAGPGFAQSNRTDPATASPPPVATAPAEWLVYVGTYTGAKSKGIYLFRLQAATGVLQSEGLAGEVENPAFLAVDARRNRLYAAGELASFRGKKSGAVSAFAIDPRSGRLKLLSQQVSGGSGACHISLDQAHKQLLVANYSSGTVAAVPLLPQDELGEPYSVQHHGSGPNARRQESPHAHSINPDPAGRFALAVDLGADKVFIYRLGDAQALVPHDPPAVSLPPGSGPRHLAFHPGGRFVYINHELNSAVTAFKYDADRGLLREIASFPTLPPGVTQENYTAEVQVHPSGRFLYVSNRGHDSLAVFAIDAATGRLTPIGHEPTQGSFPRHFCIDPTGTWLLVTNQRSDSIVVFRIDPQTGQLRPTGVRAEAPSPVCIRFLPAGGAPAGG